MRAPHVNITGNAYQAFIAQKSQLGSMAGFEPLWIPDFLFDFQKALVEWAIRKGRAAIFADCGLGKGVRPDCPVLTPSGFVPMKDLRAGDSVIGADGRPTRIIGYFPRGVQRFYRVTFSDGVSIECDADHLWNVKSYNDAARGNPWRTISTAALAKTKLTYGTHGQSRTWQIPLVAPVEHPGGRLAVHPYLLGVLLGDGSLTTGTVSVSKPDEELIALAARVLPSGCEISQQPPTDGHCLKWSIVGASRSGPNPLTIAMVGLSLMGCKSSAKFIPHRYFVAPVADRLSLLQGLMDTDGYAGESPEFCSVSVALADGVRRLVESLGGTANIATKESPAYTHNGETRYGQTAYRVTFTLPPQFNPFRLNRKASAYKSVSRGLGRWIDSIEPVEQGESICIKVDAPDGLFVIDRYVVTHNTPMQLVWAENVARKTGGTVLILTPLAVSQQTEREADKFGIECERSQDGTHSKRIVITNYERLHHFNASDFAGIVCDESSILKSFSGATRKLVTRFMSKMPYRLLCTATAAPNDYIELGTSAEALGELSHSDMLRRFFKYLDDKDQKRETRRQDDAEKIIGSDPSYYKKLAYRVSQTIGQWRLKHHAVIPFWRWVSSWAMACRKPSDIGFNDERFLLPPLIEKDHIIKPDSPPEGMLFNCPGIGLAAERAERRRTLAQRCEHVAKLVNHKKSAVVWCHMNCEADALEEAIPDARQVSGDTPDELKEDTYEAFCNGSLRVLIIKPKIGAWGLNWSHCSHVVTFASHSYEQYYQSIRRCWRFGQKNPVRLDVVSTEGEVRVLGNMRRKAERAEIMFESLIQQMNNATRIDRTNTHTKRMEIPSWLSKTSR